MKAKILSLLLAIIVGAGMLAATANAGVPEMWFFEIQASGKGLEANTDAGTGPPPPVFAEAKHTLSPVTFYAMYIRESRALIPAIYAESSSTWVSDISFQIAETEKNALPVIGSVFKMYIESVNGRDVPIYGNGNFVIQFKAKGSVVTSARLKSIGMGYLVLLDSAPSNATIRHGSLKMKGKKIDQADVPPEVLAAFGI